MALFAVGQNATFVRPGDAPIRLHENDGTRAAACPPSTAIRDLEWNNVRALLETGGSMWQDRANYRAAYEVPKNVGVSVVFAAALWMGGISPDQQLKLAAVRFRQQGNDYWPGPLTNDGLAEIDETTCLEWDRFFVSERQDSERHRQYWDCVNDPTCDPDIEFPDGYIMPEYFNEYPAIGNTALNQDLYLAPFYDYDGNGFYNPTNGDYPWYDFLQEINCFERRREDPVPLFGDQTYYWIFNDKGNIHSESQGEPIGMEIRSQAFAFATNDEINNMTFYNYTLINQGTQTLTNTYFGSWVESDVGGHVDDYVGCDVQRGLGYAYNGDAFDEPSSLSFGYGENPPAFGVDFFEGPFQDEDDQDNPLVEDYIEASDGAGIPYRGIGIGYGDGVIDNERFGMSKFVFFNYQNGPNGPPTTATDYYNYLTGFWKNGQRMAYGGNGLTELSGADLSVAANYMFPGDTDPFNWGTEGVNVEDWTEQTSGNPPGDRSFIQSAGPFTLEPGDYNNITLGVVYARATAGDPFESVELVRLADDKAQALFDNCFNLVSGPDAPDVTIQEMENELILYLTNDNPISNNFNEDYIAFDPGIPGELQDGTALDSLSRSYTFQGYQIYQLADENVSVSDLEDPDKARLIFQSDVKDGITQVINYSLDPEMGLPVAKLMADGANEGIRHSYRVVNDAFASGDNALINHKTYYFVALAYGYNNYQEFDPVLGIGQPEQYKASRKGATGAIRTYAAIPHKVNPENGGTQVFTSYGDGVEMTKIEGRGNGTNELELTEATKATILAN
ncbi:MAG: T9SS C-terminal target domain-containing protein, partial [Flavobacteriales bacterium]